jgi:S-adenosylmethionine synthetase
MNTKFFPAEFVFPGHPDKLCDAIADGLVQAAFALEQRALVGVEVACHRNKVFITGRIGCEDAEKIDIEKIVRAVYQSAGYGGDWYPSPAQLEITSDLCLGPLEDGEGEFRELSDDQAICVGYANDIEATNGLPVEHWLAARFAKRLYQLREELPELGLGPDGKVIVVVQESEGVWQLDRLSCSLQQKTAHDEIALFRAIRAAVEAELIQLAQLLTGLSPKMPDDITVNGAGAFEVGGPEGDNGLSGKKLVMDAYGPRVPIGGGAWSGKDFFKADRAGGLHARRIAKHIVRLGLATEATVVLGWFPGNRSAQILRITDHLGQQVKLKNMDALFDTSLFTSGEKFGSNELTELARWGHFFNENCIWEFLHQI